MASVNNPSEKKTTKANDDAPSTPNKRQKVLSVTPATSGDARGYAVSDASQSASNYDTKVLTTSDIAEMRDNHYVKVTSPYRVQLRVIDISTLNPISKATQNQKQRQKMCVAGVQEDGTVVLVEQWIDVNLFDEYLELRQKEPTELTKVQVNTLKGNLNYVSAPKIEGGDVLLSIQIGSVPGTRKQKDGPQAIVQQVNTYDRDFYEHALCKIKLPELARPVVVAIQLTEDNVKKYKNKFANKDPTSWKPIHVEDEDVVPDVELTEENFFD